MSNSVRFARDVGLAPKTRRDVTAFILIGSVVLFLYVQCIICTFTKGKILIFKPSMHFIHCKLVEKKSIARETYEIIRMRPDIDSVLRCIVDKWHKS